MKNLLFIIAGMCLLLVISCEKEGGEIDSVDVQKEIWNFADRYGAGCSGSDSTDVIYPHCDCFTMEELQALYNGQPWPFGWYSDVPGGCKEAPYGQLMEVWLTNIGQPARNDNFSAQAGNINGLPFASQARFNHLTGQFDELCGGYTSAENASNCALILKDFIQQMRASHPSWDYCVRFP